MRFHTLLKVTLTAALLGCVAAGNMEAKMAGKPFGKSPEGATIELFTLKNDKGMEVAVMTWGAAIVSLKVPDAAGHFDDVVLGYDDGDSYVKNPQFFGAIVGRYGNRIGKSRFTLDGHEYHVTANEGENSLHGGKRGFDKRVWTALHADDHTVELQYVSADGEEGYPGNLTATVRYTLTPYNELLIHYTVTTDKDTVQNLTNHSYFNLAGAGNGTILDEDIQINADRFTVVDGGFIPTGELRNVEGTPMDFRKPMKIGARIDSPYQQLQASSHPGYDHNWVLNKKDESRTLAARVHDPKSGRVLEVLTTEPGVQFYTGNFMDGTVRGKGGKLYAYRGALCLETQHFPDSPNQPSFPSTELKAGQTYESTTVFKFSTVK
ncbi:MAG: aldose epimerase family protein [Bryobacteraceae bacterium]